MLIHWLWLSTRPSLNDRQKKLVLDAFGDPEDVFYAEKSAYARVEGLTKENISALLDKNLTEADKIQRQCVDKKIGICTYQDRIYPSRLWHIIDPPLVLYYAGNLPDMESLPVIAAVGTRKASLYGLNVAQRMGYQMASCGALLVSGIAEGIDAAAMQGALMAGCPVIGVLGCGVDIVYPKVNKHLFADTTRNGCLISEYPPETPPYRWNFPRRNRIISGLSNGIVVIEAPKASGSLITARQALEQGRDVFCVPGNVDMESFVGSNALLREGATPVRDGWDVVEEYLPLYPGKLHPMNVENLPRQMENTPEKVAQKPRVPRKTRLADKKSEKITVDKPKAQPYSDLQDIIPTLTDTQRTIVELLTTEQLVDDVIAKSGQSAARITAELTILEIKGIVKRLPGKRICLK